MRSDHYAIAFDRPAADFLESLQIGEGRLGASVYGELLREQLVLNESSMWSGSRQEADRMDAAQYLPRIRQLLREGRNYEAQELFARHFTCKGKGTDYAHGCEVPFGCYQVLGRVLISYFQAVSHGRQDSCDVSDYRRYLDLKRGIARVSFALGGKRYTREYLAVRQWNAIYVHYTCSEPGQIDFSCGLDRDERFAVKGLADDVRAGLLMTGQLEDGLGTDQGIHYACAMGAAAAGGTVFAEPMRLHVKGADEAWIVVTARTDLSGFMGKEACDPEKAAAEDLRGALDACQSWPDVTEKHREWYEAQFGSMALSLGKRKRTDGDALCVTTERRIRDYLDGSGDEGLVELMVQYARYQIIASSQKDGFASNLQGIWADEVITPWNGDWHLNAQQMIYWLAEKANLADCHIPFLKLTKELTGPGGRTAKAYYEAGGWLAHTCTNPWGFTSPCEDAAWGSTTGSPAWQCHHLWEHYLYTGDREYLKWAYPVMKGAAVFYRDILVEDEKGRLVTSPSSSPENSFLDEQGRITSLCEGPAYDRELVYSLMDYCIQAQFVLKDDPDFAGELSGLLPRLAPVEIASDGRIREWGEEYREPYPHHRHLSHLWGVYPGSMISREKTPEYARAAEKSLRQRGKTTAGWAIAFRGCLWARLREGEEAYNCLCDALRFACSDNLMNLAYHCDETLDVPRPPRLGSARYPFQIDGNQGIASAILLTILDEDARIDRTGIMEVDLYLLPALPAAWQEGSVRGIRTKGGCAVDMEWAQGRLICLGICGPKGRRITLHYHGCEEKLVLAGDGYFREF